MESFATTLAGLCIDKKQLLLVWSRAYFSDQDARDLTHTHTHTPVRAKSRIGTTKSRSVTSVAYRSFHRQGVPFTTQDDNR
eukprot:6472370-Amphidinium_carterae.1